jgi:ribosome-binding factor A
MEMKNRDHHHSDHKAAQLCSQVQRALDYSINENLSEDLAVRVAEVIPAPNTGHLLIVVEPLEQLDVEKLPTIVELLSKEVGRLRGEIAHAINRKKTPSISITIRPNLAFPQ